MSEKKHILICGEVGVGKSTLIRRLLAHNQRQLRGFITKRVPVQGRDGESAVYLHPAAQTERERTYGAENLVGECGQTIRAVYPQVFDQLGVSLLQVPEGSLLLMDELGFMENDAMQFRTAVLRALDGDTPVLAAVKPRDTQFLQQVRSHPKGTLHVITVQNRDALYQLLYPRIMEWNHACK